MTKRQSRGYAWEKKVVDIFDRMGFVVTRLGGTTIVMPDVSAHLDKEKIMEIGANRVPMREQTITIMTHCHSSITTGILIRAFEQGKNFNVICTETRPRFQGRLTAQELIDAGIDTTMFSDSAMRWCMRNHEISFILIGADAITSEGTVLNKIGSRLLALASRELHVPVYVATPLLKFNPKSSFGSLEKIDMRPEEEVWPKSDRPAKLKILNPAFETGLLVS